MRTCTVPGCGLKHRSKGYCNRHYQLYRHHGTPELLTRPSVAERFWANVRKTKNCWLWTASTRSGYGQFYYDGRQRLAHRWSYQNAIGPIPEGRVVDHACRNRLCVNPAHLQVVTVMENSQNHGGATVRSQSGVRNVWWAPNEQKWVGQVRHDGRIYSIGRHATLEAAAEAARSLRNHLWGNNPIDRGDAA